MQTIPETTTAGYRPGDPGYRRLSVALFAAGLATFAMLYSTQPLLPELADEFHVSPSQSAFTVSLATLGLGIALLVAGPALGGHRPHQADALVRGDRRGHRCALRLRAELAYTPGTSRSAGRRTGRPPCGRDGVPAGRGPREQPRPGQRPVRRRYGGRRHDRSPSRRWPGRPGRLAVQRSAASPCSAWSAPCSSADCCPLRRTSSRLHRVRGGFWSRPVRVLKDPALLALYGIAATAMGAFVAVYNATGFRLAAAPYGLGPAGRTGVLVYLLGSAGSAAPGGWRTATADAPSSRSAA